MNRRQILPPLALAACIALAEARATTTSVQPRTPASDAAAAAVARQVLRDLNPVERTLNEWGTLSASDFLLLPSKDQFPLGLTNATSAYIERARSTRSGSALITDQRKLIGRADLTVDTVPAINAGRPPASGPALVPTGSSTIVTNLVLPNGSVATVTNTVATSGSAASGSGPQFSSDSLGNAPAPIPAILAGNGDSAISERQALEQGISDKLYERLLSQITQPKDLMEDQVVVFGIIQVSCQPGWRTVNDYIGDLHVGVSFAKRASSSEVKSANGSDLSLWETSSKSAPSIYAVLPLTDSLQFDLASRRRRELDLAATLAGTFAAQGLNGAAKMMARYIRERDSALESASMLPVATTYTDGGSFGFRIYPRPQGITQPGDPYSGAGNVLQPVSFPALVGIIVDRNEFDSGCEWSHLRIDTHTRWIPVQGRPGPLKKAVRWFAPNYRGGNLRDQLDPGELGQAIAKFEAAETKLRAVSTPENASQPSVALAHRMIEAHRNRLFGQTRFARLRGCASETKAESKPLKIETLLPGTILNTNAPVVFSLRLQNVATNAQETPKVWIGGVEASDVRFERIEDSMLVIARVGLPQGRGPGSLSAVVAVGTQLAMAEFPFVFPGKPGGDSGTGGKGLKVSNGAKLRLEGQVPVQVEVQPE